MVRPGAAGPREESLWLWVPHVSGAGSWARWSRGSLGGKLCALSGVPGRLELRSV